jgi:hypothetical protein
MIEASSKASVWGIRPTLEPLYQRRVMILAVDDIFGKPGARCGECVGNASNTLSIWPLYDPRSNGKWKKLRQISAALIVAASKCVACAWTTF